MSQKRSFPVTAAASCLEIAANLPFSTVQLGLARSGWPAFLVSAVWLGAVGLVG